MIQPCRLSVRRMHGMHVLSELRVEIKGRWLLTSPWHRCPTPPSVLDYSLHCMALCMGQECAHPHMLQPVWAPAVGHVPLLLGGWRRGSTLWGGGGDGSEVRCMVMRACKALLLPSLLLSSLRLMDCRSAWLESAW